MKKNIQDWISKPNRIWQDFSNFAVHTDSLIEYWKHRHHYRSFSGMLWTRSLVMEWSPCTPCFKKVTASNSNTKKGLSELSWAWRDGEMVQQLREFATRTHMLEGQNPLPQAVLCAMYHGTYMHHSHIQINKCKTNWLSWLIRTLNCFILVKHSSKK